MTPRPPRRRPGRHAPGCRPPKVTAAGQAGGTGRLWQADRTARVDDLVEGDRRLVLHARAARLRSDRQNAQLVLAAAADPGVGAGAALQLVRAVLVDSEQAGLRVEGLRARAVRVLHGDRAVGEGEGADVVRALVIDCRGGEDAAGDDG